MKHSIYITLLTLISFASCQSNLNFENIEVEPSPILVTPLVSFTLDQNDFYDFDNLTEIEIISDTTRYTFFQDAFVRDNITRLDLDYRIDNGFDRDFNIGIVLLDPSNNVTFRRNIFAQSNTPDIAARIVVNVESEPQILDTDKIVVRVFMTSGSTPIDPNQEQIFEFKSTGTAYLQF